MDTTKHLTGRTSTLLIALLMAILLTACATPPPSRVDDTAMRTIIESAYSENIYIEGVIAQCASLGGDVETDMRTKQQQWRNETSTLLRAGDLYYRDLVKDSTFSYHDHRVSLDTVRFTYEQLQKVSERTEFMRFSNTNRKRMCTRLADDFMQNSRTLALQQNNPQAYTQIMTYAGQLTNTNNTSFMLPSLIGDFVMDAEKGRSAFHIEKLLKELQCTPELMITLENNWPNETYVGYCREGSARLVECTWGNCKINH